jgi:hypothetical protein
MEMSNRLIDSSSRVILGVLAVAAVVAAAIVLVTVLPRHMVSTTRLTPDQQAQHIDTARTALSRPRGRGVATRWRPRTYADPIDPLDAVRLDGRCTGRRSAARGTRATCFRRSVDRVD